MSRTMFSRRMRQRRDRREFERALSTASPAMHQELLAAASRSNGMNR